MADYKHPKVFFRKLGRENAHGQAIDWGREKYIEIDPRTRGKKLLDTYIHERLHFIFPEMEEEDVTLTGQTLADFLWKHGYRKVED